jgi:uncharacterized protein YceK
LEFVDIIDTYLQGWSSISLLTPPFNGYAAFHTLESTNTRHDTNTNELRIDTLDYTCAICKAVPDPHNMPVTAIITDTLINPIDIVTEL